MRFITSSLFFIVKDNFLKTFLIMSNINKIKVSGTTYSIQDLNATKTVELTQAEYDALSVKDPNVFYIITDAQGADLSNYYTKSETSGATEISTALASKADTATTYTKTETDNAITAATSTKQDTLVSGTNIKTINSQSILGEGNITIEGGGGGGSITIDPSLDSGSTNAVANSAITNAINSKENHLTNYLETWTIYKKYSNGCNALYFTYRKNDEDVTGWFPFANINGKSVESENNFSLVETSAITTSVTSASTDSQVPSAKAVYDQFGGLKLVKLTQSEYDSLTTKDNSTLYVILN